MKQLVALLDVPAPDQFTRIRLIVRDEQGRLWTSGTTENRSLSEQELDDLEFRGFALRSEQKRPVILLQDEEGCELKNPAGAWVGKAVAEQNSQLSSAQHLLMPRHAIEVNLHPWCGWFWLDEPAAIQKIRQEWVERLGHHATQVDPQERRRIGALMMATLPKDDLTRAVRIVDLDETEATAWLKRQLAAEGRRCSDEELKGYLNQLKQKLPKPRIHLSVRKERRGVPRERKTSGRVALFNFQSGAAA